MRLIFIEKFDYKNYKHIIIHICLWYEAFLSNISQSMYYAFEI